MYGHAASERLLEGFQTFPKSRPHSEVCKIALETSNANVNPTECILNLNRKWIAHSQTITEGRQAGSVVPHDAITERCDLGIISIFSVSIASLFHYSKSELYSDKR